MFRLKQIELLGFKSFADRTRLQFGEGTVAIVGPNGCGKSNVSDAIAWVLGEQSARMLRGDRMADVIFNGTSARPPISLAEASLTLIDPESLGLDAGAPEGPPVEEALDGNPRLPAVVAGTDNGNGHGAGANGSEPAPPLRGPRLQHRAGEITVTRRLFRSGESEYLLNGELCRLRDIQDLFMGTGLGPGSYAIIEQGRIGQILSSKPSERRAIIEEAAGVSKFRMRKRLAEAKLESSRQNLARITDILEEVTKQVNSLKRQAAKSRRHRELSEAIRERLRLVLASRWRMLEGEVRRLRGLSAAAQEECAQTARELAAAEEQQGAVLARCEDLERELEEVRARLAQAELDQERGRSRAEQARARSAGLEARSAEALGDDAQLEAQSQSLEAALAEQSRRAAVMAEESSAARVEAERLAARQAGLSAELAEAEDDLEACRRGVLAAVGRAAELRNQLVQAEEMLLALERQAARTQAERAATEEEGAKVAAELAGFQAESERSQRALAELAQALSAGQSALQMARTETSARAEELEALRREYSEVAARRQVLGESLERHAYANESVRRLLAVAAAGETRELRPQGVLADFVEVEAGYEDAVQGFLERELDGVVVEHHDEARRGIHWLQKEGTGRSTFFVRQYHSNGHANGGPTKRDTPPADVAVPLRTLVRFHSRLGLNGDLPLPSLANAYVVEDAGLAERLASEYPQGHFLTPAGDHYHHRLVSGGKASNGGPLALRRELREHDRRAVELEAAVGGAQRAHEESGVRARERETQIRDLEAARAEGEKQRALIEEKRRHAEEARGVVQRRLEVLLSESTATERNRRAVLERRTALEAEFQAAAAEQARLESELTGAGQRVRELRSQADQLAGQVAEARAQASALEERRRGGEAELRGLKAQAEEVRQRRCRLEQQCAGWNREREQLEQEAERLDAYLVELDGLRQQARLRLSELEAELAGSREKRQSATEAVNLARTSLDARRERRSEAEVTLARVESDLGYHAQQCREQLHLEPAALAEELGAGQALTGESLATAEEELRDLKARLENLGPVNMMALDELQEAEERFAFLETQRQDLLASIEDTVEAIREIDQVSRRQFLEAFQTINTYFAESFRTLFGGGVGAMRLSDEADAESGIDLVAQPPGKRLQNVLLLSGGEKALTALALLIAIFRLTPSPFCVLDEVDAPLDDSNVERFTRMIRNMSRQTQFILITHNKHTMAICPVLYGVTMQEPGVSKLVSVRFEAPQQQEAVAVAG